MPHASQPMTLFVKNGRFEIDPTEPEADESHDIQPRLGEPANGLIAATNNAAAIRTGIKKGNVHLDTEPALDPDTWDEVIDTTFTSNTGYARIGSYEHAMDLNIAHQGPGTYWLRLHAKGRDSQPGASRRRNSKPSAEHYLFHIWPAPAAPRPCTRPPAPSATHCAPGSRRWPSGARSGPWTTGSAPSP
ncbi:hypothetical protein ACFV1C_01240 [Streptomyces sp. NPDC059605]|uniref:hypothetical protein n=1 Tax=unclassified Streptomyces TaxID=2593676 RepID=UPI00369B35DB